MPTSGGVPSTGGIPGTGGALSTGGIPGTGGTRTPDGAVVSDTSSVEAGCSCSGALSWECYCSAYDCSAELNDYRPDGGLPTNVRAIREYADCNLVVVTYQLGYDPEISKVFDLTTGALVGDQKAGDTPMRCPFGDGGTVWKLSAGTFPGGGCTVTKCTVGALGGPYCGSGGSGGSGDSGSGGGGGSGGALGGSYGGGNTCSCNGGSMSLDCFWAKRTDGSARSRMARPSFLSVTIHLSVCASHRFEGTSGQLCPGHLFSIRPGVQPSGCVTGARASILERDSVEVSATPKGRHPHVSALEVLGRSGLPEPRCFEVRTGVSPLCPVSRRISALVHRPSGA